MGVIEKKAGYPLGELLTIIEANVCVVLGCDQKEQKLSTEKILYTCNKLGYMRL